MEQIPSLVCLQWQLPPVVLVPGARMGEPVVLPPGSPAAHKGCLDNLDNAALLQSRYVGRACPRVQRYVDQLAQRYAAWVHPGLQRDEVDHYQRPAPSVLSAGAPPVGRCSYQ